MNPNTEEFLYFLLWTTDTLMRPTWRNVNDSFEQWTWRSGLGRRMQELSRRKLIETEEKGAAPSLARVVRLTERGRLIALGGRDAGECWRRSWDGLWRLVMFDLPSSQRRLRMQLWRLLTDRHYGYLQNSVWISPDPVAEIKETLNALPSAADVLLCLEGRPSTGESDGDIVNAAWNFAEIDRRYSRCLEILDEAPPTSGSKLVEWARREQTAWKRVMQIDPLLPLALHPSGYLGPKAWTRRKAVFVRLLRESVDGKARA
jgi:phenylacetic acid degradation operon negative regulatory protein